MCTSTMSWQHRISAKVQLCNILSIFSRCTQVFNNRSKGHKHITMLISFTPGERIHGTQQTEGLGVCRAGLHVMAEKTISALTRKQTPSHLAYKSSFDSQSHPYQSIYQWTQREGPTVKFVLPVPCLVVTLTCTGISPIFYQQLQLHFFPSKWGFPEVDLKHTPATDLPWAFPHGFPFHPSNSIFPMQYSSFIFCTPVPNGGNRKIYNFQALSPKYN